MSQAFVEQLFAETLHGDYDDKTSWDAVHKLRRLGTREVFDAATAWCKSKDPLRRARGVDVLAQLGITTGHPAGSFREERYSAIVDLLQREKEVLPLDSAIAALGHLDDPRAVPLLAQFHSHSNPEIRLAVACALGSFANDPLGVETLLALMTDTDAEVRDWATFGLGVQGDVDSPEIREALVRLLNDPNEDAREEAMVGLAKRRDNRVLTMLLRALDEPTMTDRVIEAAYLMLGMGNEREDWGPADYAMALRQRFAV